MAATKPYPKELVPRRDVGELQQSGVPRWEHSYMCGVCPVTGGLEGFTDFGFKFQMSKILLIYIPNLEIFIHLLYFIAFVAKYSSQLRVPPSMQWQPRPLCFQPTGHQTIKPDAVFKLEQKPWRVNEEIVSHHFSGEKESGVQHTVEVKSQVSDDRLALLKCYL